MPGIFRHLQELTMHEAVVSTLNHDTELEEILTDLTNFMVWEGQQSWKPDYDREANRKNSQDRATAALHTYLYKQTLGLIGEDFPKPPLGDFWNVGQNHLKAQLRKAAVERWGQE